MVHQSTWKDVSNKMTTTIVVLFEDEPNPKVEECLYFKNKSVMFSYLQGEHFNAKIEDYNSANLSNGAIKINNHFKYRYRVVEVIS